MGKSNIQIESFIGHFSFFRSVLWVIAVNLLASNYFEELQNDPVRKYFSVCYQFYVFFAIYAYMQLMQGLRHVSMCI